MSERDELAKLLFLSDNNSAKDAEAEWEFLQARPKYLRYVYEMADALIDAGYRRVSE